MSVTDEKDKPYRFGMTYDDYMAQCERYADKCPLHPWEPEGDCDECRRAGTDRL